MLFAKVENCILKIGFLKGQGDISFMGLEKILDDIERKGKQEGKEEVAKQLIRMGMDNSSIAQATGFSVETIEDWRKQAY